jgi:DDE superfamily endonuclease/Helix-turn-helix of DDE superfamily endonuclease
MIARLDNLRRHPAVFRHLTGLTIGVFDDLAAELVPAFHADRRARLDRPGRRRAVGGGDAFDLGVADQLLLTVVWLRHYPTQECLGFLFGASDSSALRAVRRCLPLLERSGKDTMRLPDPGRGRRRPLAALLADTPGLAVLVDTFEQRVQRPRYRQRAYYSGKKKAHTLKSQVAVDEETGRFAHVADSRPGPWADMKVLKRSGLKGLLPAGVGVLGDLAYVGVAGWHPQGLGAAPRRKPRGRPRPAGDARYNRALARRRVAVEHAIGRLRRYQALAQADRHYRRGHGARVRAAAGLVNRMLDQRAG